ncbi:hypothetical protein NL676_016203 [Syzygium grande]|nr:hypothetical protein NL676_016203 [Syzygium grande]
MSIDIPTRECLTKNVLDMDMQIPNIPGLYGYVRNKEKLPQHAAKMVSDVHPVTVEIPPPVDSREARVDEQQPEGATDLGLICRVIS